MRTAARVLLSAAGLVLLGAAGVVNYSESVLRVAQANVVVQLPGVGAGQLSFPVWWVLVGLPLVLLGIGIAFSSFRGCLRKLGRSPGALAAVLAVLVVVGFSMYPWEHGQLPAEVRGPRIAFYLTLAGTGLALLLAGAYRALRFLDKPVLRIYEALMEMDRRLFMVLCFGFALVAANLVSLFVFEHLPHVQDSAAQLFQAKVFASGRLYLEAPWYADFFDHTHVVNDGRWYSQYPFMHSLLLVPWVMLGIPWIANPLFGALAVPVIYLLGRELFSERTGRLAGVLASFSPLIVCMSAEYMNHASALLFVCLFLLFFFRTERKGRWRQAVLGGVCLGVAADIRPYTTLAIAVPLAAYGLFVMVKEPRRFAPKLAVMAVCAGGVTSLLLLHNWLMNRDPFLFGYIANWGRMYGLGLGSATLGANLTPLMALTNTGHSLILVNRCLLEWPVPALLIVGFVFASRTRNRGDWLLVSCLLSLVAAYFFYWFHDACFGPRFLYEASGCLILLTVRAGERLGPFLSRDCGVDVQDRPVSRFLCRFVPVALVVTLGIGLPPLLVQYRGYWGVEGRALRRVRQAGLENALVFSRRYREVWDANRIRLDGGVVYAHDNGVLNSALTIAYPGRDCYYLHRDTLRPLKDLEYPESALRRSLDEMAGFIADLPLESFRTVIWPFPEVLFPLEVPAGTGVVDFTKVTRSVSTGRSRFEDYLPALGCRVLGDSRRRLWPFVHMEELESFIYGTAQFTLLAVTSEGTAAVFDIRPAVRTERAGTD